MRRSCWRRELRKPQLPGISCGNGARGGDGNIAHSRIQLVDICRFRQQNQLSYEQHWQLQMDAGAPRSSARATASASISRPASMRKTEVSDVSVTPVAVIGMACRLPGGINSPDELWDALLRGDDFVTKVPLDRWDAEEYYDPEPGVPGRSVSKWGAFLDDVAGFDAEFFGINEREAIAIDPQHRLLLETSWEAVEHAGIDPASAFGLAHRGVHRHDSRRLPVAGRRRQRDRGALRLHRQQLQPRVRAHRLHARRARAGLHRRLGVLLEPLGDPHGLPQPPRR